MEANLVHGPGEVQGQPFRLPAYARRFLARLYEYDEARCTGWGTPDHRCKLRHRRALLGVAKGNAKSELMAAVGLEQLAGPTAPPSPEVIVVAASFEQADILFGTARTMVTEGPLYDLFDTFDSEIVPKEQPGILRRVAAAAGTNDGARPTALIVDEAHEFTGGRERVHLVLSNGLAKRGGLELDISTAGNDRDTLLGLLYDRGRQVASGEVADPAFLFEWWEADTRLDLTDPEQLRTAIRQANPATADWLDVATIEARLHDPLVPEHEFRRYYLNMWVSSPEHWIAPEHWALLADPGPPPAPGTRIVLGFDGSVRRDCTALVGCTVEGPTRHLFVVRTWEPDGQPVPRLEVDAAIREAMGRWDVVELACDPNGWREDVEQWAIEYGAARVLAWEPVASRSAPAADALRSAVKSAVEGVDPLLLTHDDDPTLARHVANARAKATRYGEHITKDHPDSPRRIDAAMAAIIAYDRARGWTPPPPKVMPQFIPFTDDDF